MNLDTYQQTNAAFKFRCIYHLGVRSGFFSEYNNMIWAMIYCLRCELTFYLATRDANFAFKKGWQDYFLPFCPERQSWLHHRWLHPRFPTERLSFLLKEKIFGSVIRQLENADALTYDIWNGMRSQQAGDITLRALGHSGTLRELSRELVDMTWRFNPETRAILDARRAELKLPGHYLGLHIRGGDKKKEAVLLDVSAYMDKARAVSGLRDIFVMSDDYANIELLRQRYPDYRFHTLTSPKAGGYQHRVHARSGKLARREHYHELFASVEIMRHADAIVCAFTSNIGIFLGMSMPPDRCHSVDGTWKMW